MKRMFWALALALLGTQDAAAFEPWRVEGGATVTLPTSGLEVTLPRLGPDRFFWLSGRAFLDSRGGTRTTDGLTIRSKRAGSHSYKIQIGVASEPCNALSPEADEWSRPEHSRPVTLAGREWEMIGPEPRIYAASGIVTLCITHGQLELAMVVAYQGPKKLDQAGY